MRVGLRVGLRVGDRVLYRGERWMVKAVHPIAGTVTIEDDEGFAVTVPVAAVKPVEQVA